MRPELGRICSGRYPLSKLRTVIFRIPVRQITPQAKGIVLQEVSIYYKEADARPAIYLDDVSGLKLKAFLVDDKKMKATAAMLVQKGSTGIEITE